MIKVMSRGGRYKFCPGGVCVCVCVNGVNHVLGELQIIYWVVYILLSWGMCYDV